MGALTLSGPFFLVEGLDVIAFSNLREVETFLDPYTAGGNRLFRFDGAELSLTTKGQGPRTPIYKRKVVATEDVIGHDPSHLANALRSWLAGPLPKRLARRAGATTMSAEELEVAELPKLVEEFMR